MSNGNNNIDKSVLEVFGEKSKDGDDFKQNMGMLLNSLINPSEIRRDWETGVQDDYGMLEKDDIEKLEKVFGSEQFEGSPYEFLEKKGVFKPNDAKGGYYQGWDKDTKEIYDILGIMQHHGFGGTGNPLIENQAYIDYEKQMEKYGDPQTQWTEEMQPMEKGKGLMALLQRILPGGKTGMK